MNTGRSLLTLDNVHPKTDGVIPFDFFVVDSGALVADQNKTPIFEDWIDSTAARKAMNIGNIENVFFRQKMDMYRLKIRCRSCLAEFLILNRI